jgi:hypothetical protein
MYMAVVPYCLGNNDKKNVCTCSIHVILKKYFHLRLIESMDESLQVLRVDCPLIGLFFPHLNMQKFLSFSLFTAGSSVLPAHKHRDGSTCSLHCCILRGLCIE